LTKPSALHVGLGLDERAKLSAQTGILLDDEDAGRIGCEVA
jgi:hypothetical protein